MRTDTIIIVETLVYSLRQNKLVWGGQSKTTNPPNLNRVIENTAEQVADELVGKGSLRKRPTRRHERPQPREYRVCRSNETDQDSVKSVTGRRERSISRAALAALRSYCLWCRLPQRHAGARSSAIPVASPRRATSSSASSVGSTPKVRGRRLSARDAVLVSPRARSGSALRSHGAIDDRAQWWPASLRATFASFRKPSNTT
jgi:hypothetical protein